MLVGLVNPTYSAASAEWREKPALPSRPNLRQILPVIRVGECFLGAADSV